MAKIPDLNKKVKIKSPIEVLIEKVHPMLKNRKEAAGFITGHPYSIRYRNRMMEYLEAIGLLVKANHKKHKKLLEQMKKQVKQ